MGRLFRGPFFCRALHHSTRCLSGRERDEFLVNLYRRELGKSQPDLALTWNNLARLYASMGKSKNARLFFNRSLKLLAHALGKSHPATRAVERKLRNMHTISRSRPTAAGKSRST
jgi:hypothetical protein